MPQTCTSICESARTQRSVPGRYICLYGGLRLGSGQHNPVIMIQELKDSLAR